MPKPSEREAAMAEVLRWRVWEKNGRHGLYHAVDGDGLTTADWLKLGQALTVLTQTPAPEAVEEARAEAYAIVKRAKAACFGSVTELALVNEIATALARRTGG